MGCSSSQSYKKPQQLKRGPKIRGEWQQPERPKRNRYNKQNNNFELCTWITLSVLFCHHCTTTKWKCLISTFFNVHLLNLDMVLGNSTLGEFAYMYIWQSSSRNNRDQDWKKSKFNFQALLSPLSPSLHLKVPIMLPVLTTHLYTWKETEVHLGSFFSFV